MIVVGFVTLVAFVLWECYAPLREPFVPMKLFKDGELQKQSNKRFDLMYILGRWAAACVLVGIGAGVYYAFAIVWPTQVAVVYASGDPIEDGAVASIIGAAVITGQVAAGVFATKVSRTYASIIYPSVSMSF